VITIEPTGTADEAAINASLASGGHVELTDGDYVVDAPVKVGRDGGSLKGVNTCFGRDAYTPTCGTRVRPSANFVGAAVVEIARPDNARPVEQVRVEWFTVDVAGLAGVIGVDFCADYSNLSHVRVERADVGFRFRESNHSTWHTASSVIKYCQASSCAAYGFVIDSPSFQITDMEFKDCLSANAGVDGFHSLGGGANDYTDCFSWGSGRNAFRLAGGGNNRFDNFRFGISGEHNFVVDVDPANAYLNTWDGCRFEAAGRNAHNTYDALHVIRTSGGNTAGRGLVDGCTFSSVAGPNQPRYYINLAGKWARDWNLVGGQRDNYCASGFLIDLGLRTGKYALPA
jgi:hypothetical protein